MSSDEEPTKPERGRIIANKYLLERELGEGGMGSVWVAKHLTLDIHQAIKFIRSGRAEASRERFQKEAALLARFHGSDHVVQIRDYGDDDGLPYIVMDLLYGQTLYERLKSWSCLTMKETNHILQQIVSGLELAHSQKIIHRDLKPANIFLARSRQGGREVVKILDFGIAKLIESDSVASRATRGIGSVVYMSPEHFISDESVDARSDLWSLGIALFECLTGRLPYPFPETFRVLAQLARGKGPTLRATDLAPRLPPEIDRFFEIAFAIDKKHRFQSATEMGRSFELVANALVDLTDMSDLEPTHPRRNRNGVPLIMAPPPPMVVLPNDVSDTSTTRPINTAHAGASASNPPRLTETLDLDFGSPLHNRSVLPFIIASRQGTAEEPDADSDRSPTRLIVPKHGMAGGVRSPQGPGGNGGVAKSKISPLVGMMKALFLKVMPSNAGKTRMPPEGAVRNERSRRRNGFPFTKSHGSKVVSSIITALTRPWSARLKLLFMALGFMVCGIALVLLVSRTRGSADNERESLERSAASSEPMTSEQARPGALPSAKPSAPPSVPTPSAPTPEALPVPTPSKSALPDASATTSTSPALPKPNFQKPAPYGRPPLRPRLFEKLDSGD